MIATYFLASMLFVGYILKQIEDKAVGNFRNKVYEMVRKYYPVEEQNFNKQYNLAICLFLIFSPIAAPLIILDKILNYFKK